MGARAVVAFAEEIGPDDRIAPVGGRTHWHIGGAVAPGAREVHAPAGIVEYEPAEMTVRCLAGTTVTDLDDAVAAHGQMVPLDPAEPGRATVGGVLAAGQSGIRRLRYGPVRDLLLQARFVNAAGVVVTAGGAVVKNVSGFDLCRLLVGSLGTIGVLAEVVLRVHPRPRVTAWFRGRDDPAAVRQRLFRPASILWDGEHVWVLLEGRGADVSAERAELGPHFEEVASPPPLPQGGRVSQRPSHPPDGPFVAEIGVGTVHVTSAAVGRVIDPSAARLHQRIKETFDPTGRLNPGRVVA